LISPIELAKQLGNSLAESPEFKAYQKAKAEVEKQESAKMMIEDFRIKQMEYEQKRYNGDKLLEPYEVELNRLAEVMSMNSYIRDYMMAEYQFGQMFMEIQHIIGEAVGIENPEIPELEAE